MALFGHSHVWLEIEEGGLFGLGESHSESSSGVAGQNSVYDRRSDLGEIYAELDAYLFIM